MLTFFVIKDLLFFVKIDPRCLIYSSSYSSELLEDISKYSITCLITSFSMYLDSFKNTSGY